LETSITLTGKKASVPRHDAMETHAKTGFRYFRKWSLKIESLDY